MWEKIVIAIAAAQVGVVLAASVVIILHYARHRSMLHISLVSASYILLTALTAGSVLFQVFANPNTRPYVLAIAVIAFALGDFALWKVWFTRNDVKGYRTYETRIKKNEERLEFLEARLEILPGTEDDPIKVEIVNGDGPKVES